MCGADSNWQCDIDTGVGSSPRVRSRLGVYVGAPVARGIISACAEQTAILTSRCSAGADHLRVCGADVNAQLVNGGFVGSSPRVRSRPCPTRSWSRSPGIISACAEQTQIPRIRPALDGDHLRVCGADQVRDTMYGTSQGSSPRVRSRPLDHREHHSSTGIISACAEQTSQACIPRHPTRDHLRVCGADWLKSWVITHPLGSSPRVRSRLAVINPVAFGLRIISACAEQTPCTVGRKLP